MSRQPGRPAIPEAPQFEVDGAVFAVFAGPVAAVDAATPAVTVAYDGRNSELCKDDCDEGTCTKSMSDPYGCGSCCGCLGGCVRGYEEQLAEEVGADT